MKTLSPLRSTRRRVHIRRGAQLTLLYASLCQLGLSGCESPRRVTLTPAAPTDGLPSLTSGEVEGGASMDGTAGGTRGGERGRGASDHNAQCADDTLWSRLTPRRLRPLSRGELERVWADLLTSAPREDVTPTSNPCPPYRFEVRSEDLGEHSSAQTLHIASELNEWAGTIDAGGWLLNRSDDGRVWSLERALPEGRHLYKLVADEQHWLTDPQSAEREPDGFGGENSVAVSACDPSGDASIGGGVVGLNSAEALTLARSAFRALPVTPRPAHYPFSDHVASLRTSPERVTALLEASRDLVEALPSALADRVECLRGDLAFQSASGPLDARLEGVSRDCLVEVLDHVGGHLTRGAFSTSQLDRALEVALEHSPSVALRALALSPNALYRSELGAESELPTGERVYHLTSSEMASALSFALWGSPPDAELIELGARGALDDLDVLRAQAERLLGDPRALEQWGQFGVEWLGVEEALRAPKRADLFGRLTDRARESMLAEVRARVASALLTPSSDDSLGDRGIAALFGGGARVEEREELWWLNDELIDYYELDRALLRDASSSSSAEDDSSNALSEMSFLESDPARQADLKPYWVEVGSTEAHTPRGGVLGAGATLLSYAHSDQTSPILRGLFVRERLLCQVFGPPPPNAGGVPEVDPNATTRERFRQHSDDPSCSGCHRLIDEVGFGFEGFDAAGATRSEEAGLPIDMSGLLMGVSSLADPLEHPFVGLGELADVLASSARVRSCLVTQLRRATLGVMTVSEGLESTGGLGDQESCHMSALRTRFEGGEISLRELLIELTLTPEFRLRRDAPTEEEER